VLVDNGSTDGTAAELDRLLPLYEFARRVDVPVNRGYGYGIRSGLAAVTPSSRLAGWTHGDLQFPPEAVFEAARLAAGAVEKKILVKGLRRGRPPLDRLFTAGMSLFCSAALAAPLRDINGQPTLFSRGLEKLWLSPPDDFSLDLYAYASAVKAGYGVLRFPVENRSRGSGFSSWNRGLFSRLSLARRTAAACLAMRSVLRGERV
jgi:glycosyltransferase involved in cell wall biosynthesis